MGYRTKVTVISNGREYGPGSILPGDFPRADLAFLKIKGFVEPADEAPEGFGEPEVPIGEEDGLGTGFGGFQGLGLGVLKSPEEIFKIRSKKDVFSYAGEIGLDLGQSYGEKSLKDLQAAVVNFQEEQVEGSGDDGEPTDI